MDHQKILELLAKDQHSDLDLNIHIFDVLNSTNDKLSQLIRSDKSLPGTIVIAKEQTAGCGQQGRKWDSSPGGLYLSMLITPDLLAVNVHQLTLGIAWGIAHQLRELGILVSIKWPNDLILFNRKLGGILIQTRIAHRKVQQAIVGVGINHTNLVENNAINLVSAEADQPNYRNLSIEMLTSCTIKGIISGYKRCNPMEIDSLLSDYLELLNSRGRSAIVNGKLGTVLGVSPQGELLIGFPSATGIVHTYFAPGTFTLGYEN